MEKVRERTIYNKRSVPGNIILPIIGNTRFGSERQDKVSTAT